MAQPSPNSSGKSQLKLPHNVRSLLELTDFRNPNSKRFVLKVMKTWIKDREAIVGHALDYYEQPTNATGGTDDTSRDKNATWTVQQPTSTISAISFSVYAPEDIVRKSVVEVVNNRVHKNEQGRPPNPHSPLDPRLGAPRLEPCATCGQHIEACVGHFGHIRLALPVYHIGYLRETIRALQSICKFCSRVTIPDSDRPRLLRQMSRFHDERQADAYHKSTIFEEAKKHKVCPFCLHRNGTVKKLTTAFKIVHDVREKEKKDGQREDNLETRRFEEQFKDAVRFNAGMEEHLKRTTIDLNPLEALRLLSAVPNEDLPFLNLSGRPENLILQVLPVPPTLIRPSVDVGPSGSQEDDLSVKLMDIVYINRQIEEAFEKGNATGYLVEHWDFLQQQVAMYINSDLPGFPSSISAGNFKKIRSLTTRLKGKQGRFRQNLSGKRVNYSARSVITGNPDLRIDEVGVPVLVAKKLTFPEVVTMFNIEKLRAAVRKGPMNHPGAVMVHLSDGRKFAIREKNAHMNAARLAPGDVVERHLTDGDVVLFNRQPSLHRLSIMAHHVRIQHHCRTFSLNQCVCNPYNADFDGDEMNMHAVQTHEARAEAEELMGVARNMVTPRHAAPLVCAIQDFISAAFLLTQKDVFYDRTHFCQIVASMSDALDDVCVPPPAIFKPVKLWTGKQIFSMLLNPGALRLPADQEEDRQRNKNHNNNDVVTDPWPLVNMECRARNYTQDEVMCPNDGYVVIRNSVLLSGNACKNLLASSQDGLVNCLIRDHRAGDCARFLNRLAKLSARWIGDHGFSFGISDVTPSPSLQQRKEGLLAQGYDDVTALIKLYNEGKLEPQPGFDEEQTLESQLLGKLSAIREELGKTCLEELDVRNNSALIMSICGSKGSKINISQMVACVGQQAVGGKRIENGFVDRALPHFPKRSRGAAAKGFVQNSFYSGMTATEFFFHTMAGREGLVDTAVKTADTGYLQRRLMKALEDLSVQYDGTVRSSDGAVVQFMFGDDGLDPIMMAKDTCPVVFERVLERVRATYPDRYGDQMYPDEILAFGLEKKQELKDDAIYEKYTHRFADDVYNFFYDLHIKVEQLREDFGLPLSRKAALEEFGIPPEFNMSLLTIPAGEAVSREVKADIERNTVHLTERKQMDLRVGMHALLQMCRCSKHQLDRLWTLAFDRQFKRSIVEPGTAVGAIAAQSIGEPGTQMTLKTFHFAGVASMNITQGVPRIIEIINASRSIKTPIIEAPLVHETSLESARVVKGRIEMTRLGDVCKSISEVLDRNRFYILIKLDMDAISKLQIEVTPQMVKKRLLQTTKLHLSPQDITIKKRSHALKVLNPEVGNDRKVMQTFKEVKANLMDVVVCGIPLVRRAAIMEKSGHQDDPEKHYTIKVEHDHSKDLDRLEAVWGIDGVDGVRTTSNHIAEVERVLGIEAARSTVIQEIESVMSGHGLTIDNRHVTLLADVMTSKGTVLAITRHGIAKMKDSVLTLASFEMTADHLFDAAVRGKTDGIRGVSERIVMGQPIPVGTGMFDLRQELKTSDDDKKANGDADDALVMDPTFAKDIVFFREVEEHGFDDDGAAMDTN